MVSPLAYFCSYINSFLEICRRIVRHVDVNLLTMSKGNSIMALSCAFKASKYISTYVGRIEISCWLFYTFEKYTYKTLILLKKVIFQVRGVGSKLKLGGGGHRLSGALFHTKRAPSSKCHLRHCFRFNFRNNNLHHQKAHKKTT